MTTARIYRVQPPGEAEFYIEATGHANVRDYLTKDTEIKLATRAELTALLGSGRKIASAIETESTT